MDSFHEVDDEVKEGHSTALSVLLCLAHVLPLSCESKNIMRNIFLPLDRMGPWDWPNNFHRRWTLDGWNDNIIQPARDAVLDYYKVRTPGRVCAVLTPVLIN